MWHLENSPGRTCLIQGEEFLFFSGYAYLGMNHVKEFTELVKEGIDKYGLLFPSSRISNTRLELYEEFEKDLSEFTSMEDTVSFSSGFLAGKTIAAILSSYKNILIAPGTHPAILTNANDQHTDGNFINWSQKITDSVNSSSDNEFVFICDSINILTGEINDLSFLKRIDSTKKLIVLIDNSHGIGLEGINEQHTMLSLPQANNIEYIISYSLSKALNIQGGAISCSKYFADKLRQHPNYTGSTAISPSMIHAYLHSKTLYASQRKKLFENITYFKNKSADSATLKNTFDLPVFICHKENAEEYFYNNQIIISSFRYPYSSSPKIDRIIISALHTKADIDQLCSLL